MPVERLAGSTSLVDVMDRVLDRGLRWDGTVPPDAPEPSAPVVVTSLELRAEDTPPADDTPRLPPGA
ncbi:hypothetical protein [Myxococcus faecalis]|uniref:hypothetical protein n=1 Tax=Myxococcus faecalis TaxID=3115646 RepID=UPI003CF0E585